MDSIISTFHIDWKIIVAQAVNFAIVFAVLYIYALKPLSKLMKERAEKIEQGVKDAKSNAETLENTKSEYEQVLAKAKKEAHIFSEQSKKEAEVRKNEMIEAAKVEVATIIENGKKTLGAEKTKMVEEARKEMASLVIMAVEKVMKEKGNISNEQVVKELNNL